MEGDEPKPLKEEEVPAPGASEAPEAEPKKEENGESNEVIGSAAIRPVFLGNLRGVFEAEQVTEIFTRPIVPRDTPEGTYSPLAIDRVDVKRGYCFVFLKDATSQAEKESAERFVTAINGM
jgi:arginine/serine-rich splicing factor 4/5/6